jgi:hypothetical protein
MPTSLIIFGKSVWSLGVSPLFKSIKGSGTTPNDSNRIMNQGCLGGENCLRFGFLLRVLRIKNLKFKTYERFLLKEEPLYGYHG